MDVGFTDQELAFRAEVLQFLAESFDDDLKYKLAGVEASPHLKQGMLEWQGRLNARGWLAPGWPEEYGGKNWSITQHFIFSTELGMAGAPPPMPFGVTMLAPVIYTYGNEKQKAYYLPRILNSQDWWCQGYSEPEAGSDLASLQCRAERDGNDYVINGCKTWVSFAHIADWMFCLVRTDDSGRKQEGISFVLIDMSSPGIRVEPIPTIDGVKHLNKVCFDNVRVPVENRIGDEGKGWLYAKSLLNTERLITAGVAPAKRDLAELRKLARAEINGGRSLLDDPLFSQSLVDIEINLMALEYTELRVMADAAGGKAPGPESSLLKLLGADIQQALQTLYLDVAGYYGATLQSELPEAEQGRSFVDLAQRMYFRGRAASIYGGSLEVQKNIVAKQVLGL
ncbi:MAG: acyl-CoA dehydrogenase family protein [Porticoccaceae bacterium]|jgi:alkylation response protein AidB-like acyl-CoA dehydrogenase|nr:acyl-CoA dehydrogenase family protein [Porticoccaceae bacterium]